MGRVPRHQFVPEDLQSLAYADMPVPIGHGQTISQPYVVALMTQAVRPAPTSRALDIGTGSGYQAAVLAELCKEVYSIEILKPLAESPGSGWRPWATRISRSAAAMATKAGPRKHLSTSSSWPLRRIMCPNHSSSN